MRQPAAPADPEALALDALAWIMEDDKRAVRFLDLTGLTPDGLRAGLADRATHRACHASAGSGCCAAALRSVARSAAPSKR